MKKVGYVMYINLMNILGLFLMFLDKSKSKCQKWRIKEIYL